MAVTKTLKPTQSVYIYYGSQNEQENGKDYLRVGVGSTSSKQYHTLLQFPLEEIAGGVTKATLRLYSYSDDCWNASVTQLVRRTTSSWDQAKVTWATKPSTVETNQASATVSGYDKWYEWDVTALVKDLKANTNYGFTVLQSGTATSKAKCFKRTGTYAPQLVVEYNPITFNGQEVSSIVFNGQAVTSLVFNGTKVF